MDTKQDKSVGYKKTKLRSYAKVGYAIRKGTLIKRPCEVCGSTSRVEAHHDDYNRPLEVRWLCKKCHEKWHIRNNPIKASNEIGCKRCGKKFVPNTKHYLYCSDECRRESILECNRGVASRWEKRKVEDDKNKRASISRTCKNCGKTFYSDKPMTIKYCSRDCSKKARKEQKKQEYQRNKEHYRVRNIKYKKMLRERKGKCFL